MAKILIADADGDESALIAFALRFAGHRVLAVVNPSEIADKADRFKPDLMVLDAGGSGWLESDAGQVWMARQKTAPTPIIFLVKQAGETGLGQGFKSPEHSIVKPISPDGLIKMVNNDLKKIGK
jgi:DNA-binding response OmpR family regulator